MKKLLAHLSTYFAAAACAETGAVDMAMQLLGETPPAIASDMSSESGRCGDERFLT